MRPRARRALTRNQLFRYGHALYGLQFHLEMTPGLLEEAVARAYRLLIESGVDADMDLAARAAVPCRSCGKRRP